MNTKKFVIGFLAAFLLCVGINLLTAHLMSECGLPAVFGVSARADDIVRGGFPFQFYEKGGFAYRYEFSTSVLALDIGLAFALAAGFGWWWARRK